MKMSENYIEISKAFLKAQMELVQPLKNNSNPFHKSKYADLSTCWEAASQALHNNGIFLIQSGGQSEDCDKLINTLIHAESGQWFSSEFKMSDCLPADKNHPTERKMNAQERGSALTYLRRYSLCAMLMICPEDDDGNMVSSSQKTKSDVDKKLNNQTLGANQIAEISDLMKKCPQGYECWLLDQVIQTQGVEKHIRNIPLSFYDYSKQCLLHQIKKQNEAKNG